MLTISILIILKSNDLGVALLITFQFLLTHSSSLIHLLNFTQTKTYTKNTILAISILFLPQPRWCVDNINVTISV